MTPPTAQMTPVHREDGELIGLLVPHGDEWMPSTIFGTPLGEPGPRAHAEDVLHSHGLSYLADRWEVREDGQWITVRIVEAKPLEVTVIYVDYGHPQLFNARRTLSAPTSEELRKQ